MYLIIIVIVLLYWYGVRNFSYWKNKGVKHDKPIPYLGNNAKQYFQKASIAMVATDVYRRYPEEKVVGFYRGTDKELVIRDLDIAKRILVTDCQHFYSRGFLKNKKVIEPLMKNLFFADGDLWRLLRQRISPAFSSGKLKAMFPHITERAENLQLLAQQFAGTGKVCDVRELMARYTTEVIGACGFGINMDSLSEENSVFRKLGARIFYRNIRDAFCGAMKEVFPDLSKNLCYLSPEIEKSMVTLVKSVMKQRNFVPSDRHDFIDLMLEQKQKGRMVGESIEHRNIDGSPKIVDMELDDMLITAQVFVFFGAGFETSSTTSSFTLHQLAFNPECQKKVQEEIDKVLARHDNKITYDAVKEMNYLEMSFNEAMRMYPSVAFLKRECATTGYTIPEIGLTIDETVNVIIPVQAYHNDEQYFPEPHKFDPERFRPENKANIPSFAYLPFGEGPRACVGARLGQMQSMAGLVAILQKFSVEPAPTSLKRPIQDPMGIVSEGFVGGLPLLLRKRSS
ncbi:cytochrome P450 6B5 [Plutella xylostella]|uniref:cytochrome P450 6B5 n=1 Tax=Plutella xylostella TaxID=51655 RepID=UPI0020329294|nr:cytochrome P450 6B5 [Plutella xylostella]